MKVVIYYRKSTDRDDKQANSLEHQLNNCKNTVKINWFEVIKEIWESRSAKTEWTRPWFNDLIKICKTWKVDYIVIDEAKRLSRNNLDSARIIDLMDKNLIKWIYSTWRVYLTEQINDIFLLQLDLSLSKMDNAHRSKDIKEKMITCINQTKRFLGKAPFWYKNITIKKWLKEIVIDKKEAKIVKEIYSLRLENKAYSTIANIIEKRYWKNINMTLTASRIHQLVTNKFYYWVFIWGWKEIIWKHQPLITKEIYDKANSIWKWVHQKVETIKKTINNPRTYYLKWFAKDISWYILTSYTKKWHTYYNNQPRSNQKISISEKLIFEKMWEIIKNNFKPNNILSSIDKDIILDLVEQEKWENWSELKNIDLKIEKLKSKQNNLLDLKLENLITNELYLSKNNKIENEIKELLDQKEILKKENFTQKTQYMLELSQSLYQSYFNANFEWKSYIIKKLGFELLVTTKKELQIAETPLFKSSKILNFSFGTPKEIRTPVSGVRGQRPNQLDDESI